MKQRGYFFIAGITVSDMRPVGPRQELTLQTSDMCPSAIIYGSDAEQARQIFENGAKFRPEGQEWPEVEIKMLIHAEVTDRLLAESGDLPLDWPEIAKMTEVRSDDVAVVDDLGEGFWLNVNEVVLPESIGQSMESLKRGLPEDVVSGLNWSEDQQFLFLASSLKPRQFAPYPEEQDDEANFTDTAESNQSRSVPLDQSVTDLPEMREREVVALVQARNSAVAGWLFLKFLANENRHHGEILVNPCCSISAAVPAR